MLTVLTGICLVVVFGGLLSRTARYRDFVRSSCGVAVFCVSLLLIPWPEQLPRISLLTGSN